MDGKIDKLNLVTETLITVSSGGNRVSDEDLRELEGDCYTFFHIDNLNDLKRSKVLSDIQIAAILQLRRKISVVPHVIWNKKAFEEDDQWKEIHQLAGEILVSLGISRKIP